MQETGNLREHNDQKRVLGSSLCLHGKEEGEEDQIKGTSAYSKEGGKKAQNNTNDNAHDRMRHAMGPDRVFFNGVDHGGRGIMKKNSRLACSDPVRIRA